MNRSRWIASGCITMAALALALGYTLAGEELLAPAFTILGILWLVALHRQWQVITSLALVIFVAAAGFAVWKDYSPGLMLVVLVLSVSSWDLDAMMTRFRPVEPQAIEPGIEPRHLARLAIIDGIGLVLGGIALLLRFRMSLGLGIVFGLVLFIGLSQLVIYLRRTQF